jgi:uncharacterized ion transporter superfamily protein YfcC
MDNAKIGKQNKVKDVAFRIAKAALKATFVYLLYFFAVPLLTPLFALVPGFMETIEVFVTIYIILMILGDLTERTIFHCFFNAARGLFIVAYMVFSVGDGVISVPADNFTLTVNLSILYTITALLGLLGLAKATMEAIHFMSERAEGGLKP